MGGYRTLHLDDIPTLGFEPGILPARKPVRSHLGVAAFGANAFVGERTGDVVIERHDELPESGAAAHQELYLVLGGSARFTVDGDSFDAAKGAIVFVEDHALVREAVALEPRTVVFAVGAPSGVPFEPSPREARADEIARRRAADP